MLRSETKTANYKQKQPNRNKKSQTKNKNSQTETETAITEAETNISCLKQKQKWLNRNSSTTKETVEQKQKQLSRKRNTESFPHEAEHAIKCESTKMFRSKSEVEKERRGRN